MDERDGGCGGAKGWGSGFDDARAARVYNQQLDLVTIINHFK